MAEKAIIIHTNPTFRVDNEYLMILKNALATFQWVMDNIFRISQNVCVLLYLFIIYYIICVSISGSSDLFNLTPTTIKE